MKKINSLFILVFSLLAIVACSSDDDNGPDKTPPTVEITDPNAANPYPSGSPLPLKALFKDNAGLKECTVSLQYVGSAAGKAALKGIDEPWEPADDVITFDGKKEKLVEKEKLFDENIEANCQTGSYKVTFVVTDQVDNKTQKEVIIEIVD
ncbi:DUF4625 domain-containing protein [Marinilabiliaceae bacterium JC017]|nr:DUF4625 domain-containing protein [Marinilabiliaceae bacterium JC017]